MDYRKLIARKIHKEKENHTGAIAVALLAGATIGAAITLLLAPKSGAETRALISDKTRELTDGIKDKFGIACNKVEDELEEVADTARDKYKSAKRKVKQTIDDVTDNVNI